MMDPAGPAAAEINWLWWMMLTGSAVIVIFVAGLIWLSFYSHPTTEKNKADHSLYTWIYGLGLAFPMVVLAALLVSALMVGDRLLPHPDNNVVKVEAIAEQWRWRFAYADRPGYVSEGVLHIPAGRPIDVAITTKDVIHSFWVPRLAGKLDAIPGHVNTLRIQADAPGKYKGQSAEFSGAGYTGHTFTVQVHDATSWTRFVTGDLP